MTTLGGCLKRELAEVRHVWYFDLDVGYSYVKSHRAIHFRFVHVPNSYLFRQNLKDAKPQKRYYCAHIVHILQEKEY